MIKSNDVVIRIAKDDLNNMEKILDFLGKINDEYTVSISDKVDFNDYVTKAFKVGVVLEARIENHMVGILIFYANNYVDNEGFFSLLGVLKDYRSLGIASRLTSKSIEIMKLEGMDKVVTVTHKDNEGAINFYEKNGFVIENNRRSKYIYNISLVKYL